MRTCSNCSLELDDIKFHNSALKKQKHLKIKCRNCYNQLQRRSNQKYKDKLNKHQLGYIYLIINPNYPEWIKIGRSKNVERRLYDFNIYSPLKDFTCIYSKEFKDYLLAEILVHEKLLECNIESNGEWFKVTHKKAIEITENVTS